ncbi:MAG: energy-coupling factor ABC transporter permease [Methanomassiliicoccales archaeon]|nr:energy-coupling factor ABC transporter permease [Methanomassiliicoccales archaeon]
MLPWFWCLFWWLLALPFVVYGAYKIRTIFREHPEQKLTMAVAGAYIFVLSALKIPSPVTGSSSHPTGTGFSAVLYGPAVTAVLAFIVLIFQALLIAHGGFTTLGANVFSMGIAGPMVAYAVFRVMQRSGISMAPSVFMAAFLADFVTYVVTSFQLALAFPSGGSIFASFYTFFVIFAITQVPIAIAEGILMVIFFDFMAKARPDALEGKVKVGKGIKNRKAVYALGIAMVVGIIGLAFVLNPGSGFVGSDDQASKAIQEITGGFQQWFASPWTPSPDQVYILLAVQALIGLGIIVYMLRRSRKRGEKKPKAHPGNVSIGELAYSSPARDWPPLGKLALMIALLLASLVSGNIFVPLVVLAIGVLLTFYSNHLKLPRSIVLAFLDAVVIFAVSAILIALVTGGSGTPLLAFDVLGVHIAIYAEGAQLAALVFVKAMAGVMVMLFFATSTPIPYFAQALRQLRVPAYLAELVVLVYRYSFLLLEQLDTMYMAAQCRVGFRGLRNKFRTTGKLAVGLFIRSLEVADRSENALKARNFRGDFPSYRSPARLNAAWVVLPFLVFGGLLTVNYLIAGLHLLGM